MSDESAHPLLAEREVLVKARGGGYAWVPCRVVNRDEGRGMIKVEFSPYDLGYKLWARDSYVRERQPHADTVSYPGDQP